MATLSINDALTRMLKLNNNSLTILSKLTESLTTTDQDYINVELWNADTTSKTTYKIPSYSFLQSELSGLSDSLALLNGTKTREYVELDDNVLKQTNSAITSACGSTDLLKALDINIARIPQDAKGQFHKNKISFVDESPSTLIMLKLTSVAVFKHSLANSFDILTSVKT